jgi:lipoprotein-anchoring transpeptidase ErfK/SrfK
MKRFLLIALGAALLTGCAGTTGVNSATYSVTAFKPSNPANVRVKVSLQTQNVYVFEGNKLLMAAATCVGLPEKKTPTGNFTIYSKQATKRSGSYGFRVQGDKIVGAKAGDPISGRYVGYPMPYWCEFSPGYGFHTGYVWPMPRTHGCLRLHKTVGPKFFALVSSGTPVNIAYSQPEDVQYGHFVKRPNDYRDPDPAPALMVSDSAAFAKPVGPLLIVQ